MSRNVTLLQLRTDIAAQCDFSTSTTGRYTPTLLNRLINQSIQRFRERISNEGITHFLVSSSGTLPAGRTNPYSFQTLDLSSLNPSLVRTYGFDITIAGVVRSLEHRSFNERNEFIEGPDMTGIPMAWAHFQSASVAVMPAPDTAYPYTIWYLPVLADLSADGDTFDGVAGWENYVVWDCVCQLIARDQYASAYSQAVIERDKSWEDIIRSATKVSAAGGAFVGRDTMGRAGMFARGRVRDLGAPGGASSLPPLSSITNAMLTNRSGAIVLGRLETTNGAVGDVPVPSLTSYISSFAGSRPGLVPTGTGNSTDALRGDGTWGPVSGGGGGGSSPGGPTGSVQYNAGSGALGGASGFLWNGTTLQRTGNFDMPTGSLRFGATGVPASNAPILIGGLTPLDIIVCMSDTGLAAQLMQWQIDGVNALTVGRNIAINSRHNRAADFHAWYTNSVRRQTLDGNHLGLAAGQQLGLQQHAFPTGFGDKLACWTASGFAAIATGISVVASGRALAFGTDPATSGTLRFSNGVQVNTANGSGATVRVFGSSTGNGDLSFGDNQPGTSNQFYDLGDGGTHTFRTNFVNRVLISASGLGMQGNTKLTHNGQALSASGFYGASKDIEGVRRINGVEGPKPFGNLSAAAATGIVAVNAGSGSVFHITATAGQLLALQPSAVHGDAILLQNRSSATHTVYNLGTGMGAPSGEIFKINPSGAAWARYASGAWELASRYQMGGF